MPEMCSSAGKLLALIGAGGRGVGAIFCFVSFVSFFFLLAIFAFLHAEPDSLKVTQISYSK